MSEDQAVSLPDYATLERDGIRRAQVLQAYHREALAARERGEEPPPPPPEAEQHPDLPEGYGSLDRAWGPDED